jgi:FAD:protein FMN transferase
MILTHCTIPGVLRRMRIEMGTTLVIEARGDSRAQEAAACAAAFAATKHVTERLHPEAPDSDLVRLRDAPVGTPLPICPATLAVLGFAQRLNQLSDGVFDPCLATRPGRIVDLELIEGATPRAIAHRRLEIDCGGIAKGYAVDVAIAALKRAGCSAGLVNAGGDLRVFGTPAASLLLRGRGGVCRPITLENAALAVSDRDARLPPSGHRGYYVRTGTAAARRYAAVRAPQAMTADALTKCLLLAPAELGVALLEQFSGASL